MKKLFIKTILILCFSNTLFSQPSFFKSIELENFKDSTMIQSKNKQKKEQITVFQISLKFPEGYLEFEIQESVSLLSNNLKHWTVEAMCEKGKKYVDLVGMLLQDKNLIL